MMGKPVPAPVLRTANPPVVPIPRSMAPAPPVPPAAPTPPKPAITKVEIVQAPSGADANVSNAAGVLEDVFLPPELPRNYFIPFVALSMPMDGEWTSAVGNLELEEETGFTAGFRLGREFAWGLFELEVKGFGNSYRRTNIHSLLKFFLREH